MYSLVPSLSSLREKIGAETGDKATLVCMHTYLNGTYYDLNSDTYYGWPDISRFIPTP